MRVTATRGENSVTIDIEGASPDLLRQAEATALKLLGTDTPSKPVTPFGFIVNKQESCG